MLKYFFAAVFLLSGCSLVGSEHYEKTFPDAFDYEQVDISALRATVPAPGKYNAQAFAVDRFVCPENTACYVGNSVTFAQNLTNQLQEHLRIFVQEPRQFELEERYLISVEVSEREVGKNTVRDFQLLGYSEVE